jgi:hypothetical protein
MLEAMTIQRMAATAGELTLLRPLAVATALADTALVC